MFNFNELTIVQSNDPEHYRGSFVGIRHDKYLKKMVFTLPKGFENFESNYENVKKLFFNMYRTFEKYRSNGKKYLDENPSSKDNAQVENHKNGAYIFTDEDGNETLLYSKIDLIDKIFNTYQELEIESLIQELGLVEDIDYSKIENYLDKGIYLNNHAIFIENMLADRNIVHGLPSELIELFCYIYKELATELEQECSEQIQDISYNFSFKFLSPEQSLFSEYTFDSTIMILKDCLDRIHKITAYKNHQYWDIYESIEYFLYGNLAFDKDSSQGFWGINNFSYIWEEMCNYMVANLKDYQILYCDSYLPLNQYKNNLTKKYVWIDKTFIHQNIFYLDFNGFKRWLRPDIIVKHCNDNPLNIAIEKEIISIKKTQVRETLSFGANRLNIHFYFNKNKANYNNLVLFEKIFKLFSDEFANLYRRPSVGRGVGGLKGYKYSPKGKNEFSLNNIPKNNFDEVYQNILVRGEEKNNTVFVVDWKYYSYKIFSNSNYRNDKRIDTSIIKSLAYEFCLSQIIDEPIENQFGLPFYDVQANDIVIDNRKLDCNIILVRMNFIKIQEIYLNGYFSK